MQKFASIFSYQFYIMKKKQVKLIKQKLVTAVQKVMTDNNAGLISKIEKDLRKSIKEISGKAVKATA